MAEENSQPEAPAPISLKQFFESTPPGTWVLVTDVSSQSRQGTSYSNLNLTELELYCDKDSCARELFFESTSHVSVTVGWNDEFVSYRCKNCEKSFKRFSIVVKLHKNFRDAEMFKYGEIPSFGPPTPKKVQSMLGEHRDYFFKGRRSENQGMGIAAFSYYRRVIDGQKNVIFDEIIKVSEVLKAPPELIAELHAAKNEGRFTQGIDVIKHALPQALLINGENPLTLLYTALSEGLHNDSDEECLELATSIRIVMTELADRFAAALKEQADLTKAVAKLVQKKSKKEPG